jgi:hypothetical protein
MQPQFPQTEKQRKQQENWDAVKEQGPVSYIIMTIVALLCVYEFGWLSMGYAYKRGWTHTSATFSLRNIIVDVLVGSVVGFWEWSKMQRKFEARDPAKDQTMI